MNPVLKTVVLLVMWAACVYCIYMASWYATYEKNGGRLLPISSQIILCIWWTVLATVDLVFVFLVVI